MSFVNIWVHAVWGTKYREEILEKEPREMLCQHIKEHARDKGYLIDTIDGHSDHLHALLTLNADSSICKQMQLIKGESAFWANKNKILKRRLEWADEYFAASVSETNLGFVRAYIRSQEEHHKKMTFPEEYDKFIKHFKHGQG